ncbi:MAG: hypothetical protein MJE77_00865 [Proteobacteria bacterium]|nr:hypothetical protein [Pseudomonadota bacterium]
MTEHTTLLEQFIEEECSEYVRGVIGDALVEGRKDAAVSSRLLEFNRFELTLDFEAESAFLADILEENETQLIPLHDFEARLAAKAALK